MEEKVFIQHSKCITCGREIKGTEQVSRAED